MNTVLANLGLTELNAGTWSSNGGWLSDPAARRVESINPATGLGNTNFGVITSAGDPRVMQLAIRYGF